ncbi:hypothetical protein [uncultured Brachyspira sp.]|uniref:hypothetical protein n=1 Tax=uncultured Brachyspira sp. TaxID=221953 RepID=UPI00259B89B6|nr:hypothetical protein [uncultured Brachyspira sp.]
MLKYLSIILSSLFLFSCAPAIHRVYKPHINFLHFDGILNSIIKILIIVVLVLLIKNLYDKNKSNKKE